MQAGRHIHAHPHLRHRRYVFEMHHTNEDHDANAINSNQIKSNGSIDKNCFFFEPKQIEIRIDEDRYFANVRMKNELDLRN